MLGNPHTNSKSFMVATSSHGLRFVRSSQRLVAEDVVKFSTYQREYEAFSEMFETAKEVFGADFATRVQRVVSIGNGDSEHIDFGRNALEAVGALKQLAVETKRAHVSFLKNHPELTATRYYRLNVAQGLSRIGLEDPSKRGGRSSATPRRT